MMTKFSISSLFHLGLAFADHFAKFCLFIGKRKKSFVPD
jgi:hypothetical protein